MPTYRKAEVKTKPMTEYANLQKGINGCQI